MSSSLLVAAPLKPFFLHLSQNSILRSRSLSFRSRSSATPSRITAASVFSSSNGRVEAQPYLTSSTSFDPFSPVSSAPQTRATAMRMRGLESDVIGQLLRERIVFLRSSIDDFVAVDIISQLLFLDAQDHTKDIRLFINSSGGSHSATMAIYDAVQLVRADVSTIALGFVASTASIILGSGTKGKRLSMPNTKIMIHQPTGGASGQAIDGEIQAKEIMHNKKNIIRLIASFTGCTVEQVEKDIDRDRYMSPIEAVEYGIIDGVIDRTSFRLNQC